MKTLSARGILAALIFGGLFLASPTRAQDETTRSLEIRQGAVYLDGARIPPDELPPSLETEGVQLSYTFSGPESPVISVNGAYFVIEEDGLREADEGERGRASVRLHQSSGAEDGFGFVVGDDPDDQPAPQALQMERQARQLAQQAERIQEIQARLAERIQDDFDATQMRELRRAAARLSIQAKQAAQAAEALPRLEVQHYLAGVRRHNRELFELLVQERKLDLETVRMSQEIRAIEDSDLREEQIEELRLKLHEIFELKQENRRGEIEQLEKRLEKLQERVDERERLREDIIEDRLRDLLELDNELDW